jgi:hypothetical protein
MLWSRQEFKNFLYLSHTSLIDSSATYLNTDISALILVVLLWGKNLLRKEIREVFPGTNWVSEKRVKPPLGSIFQGKREKS